MISYPVYKLLHLFGIFTILTAVAVTCFHVLRGGTRADNPWRRASALAHGLGMLLVLVGGFGMLARLGIVQGGLPGWIIAKLVVWVLFGAALELPYRRTAIAKPLLLALPFLAVLAAYFALYKPF